MIAAFTSVPERAEEISSALDSAVSKFLSDDARVLRRGATKLWATAPARMTADGASVGTAPLPYVSFELTPSGISIERGGFGGRPVYARCEDSVAIVSTDFSFIVAASRALDLDLVLDDEALARAAWLGADRTSLVRAIRVVLPATRVTLAPGAFRSTKLALPRFQKITTTDAASELRAQLGAAVDRAIDGSERVGVLTGGGLDSGALLALANARATHVNAFAIDFEGRGDDRPHLDALSRSLGIAPVRESPQNATLPPSLMAAGLPLTWPSGAAEGSLLARAREWGADRVLTGAGADQWLDGDRDLVAHVLKRDGFRAALRLALSFGGPRDALLSAARPFLRRAAPASIKRLASRYARARMPAWIGPTLARVLAEDRARAIDEIRKSDQSLEARFAAAFASSWLGQLSELALQEERLSGVLRIDPYLDLDLVTFIFGLAPITLVQGNARRGLLRDAIKGLVPESLRTRRDKASFTPIHRALFRAPLVATLRPFSNVKALAARGIVNARAFTAAFDLATRDDRAAETNGARLYAVLATEAFARHFPELRSHS